MALHMPQNIISRMFEQEIPLETRGNVAFQVRGHVCFLISVKQKMSPSLEIFQERKSPSFSQRRFAKVAGSKILSPTGVRFELANSPLLSLGVSDRQKQFLKHCSPQLGTACVCPSPHMGLGVKRTEVLIPYPSHFISRIYTTDMQAWSHRKTLQECHCSFYGQYEANHWKYWCCPSKGEYMHSVWCIHTICTTLQ